MYQHPQERPPIVRFEYRAVEDRAASISTGKYSTKDVPFAFLKRPGQKDEVEKEAESWLKQLETDAREQRCPQAWATGFRDLFEKWKRNEEIPVEGTPIKGWPALSPAQQGVIVSAGFRTVEELAGGSDTEIASIGIGAMGLREKARNWLDAANGPGKLTARVEAAEVENASLRKLVEEQAKELKRLAGLVGDKAK